VVINKYRILFAICVTSAALAPGCAPNRMKESAAEVGASPPQAAAPVAPPQEKAPSEQRLRQVIRKANMAFDVEAPASALKTASEIAERHGGFVSSSSSSAGSSRTLEAESVSATLRVPSDHFTQVLSELRKLSRGHGIERVGSEDVSEEAMDLDARLKTQRALELQFLEILKRADKVEDALHVEREIATVRAEIERMEGRRRFLEREVALSTIELSFSREKPLVSASFQDVSEAGRRAYADAIDNAAALVTFSVRALGAMLPIVLVLGAPAWLVAKRWRRRRKLAPLATAANPQ
jgi:hypothetical protein